MRRSEIIFINDRKITVKELTVKDLLNLNAQMAEGAPADLDFLDKSTGLWPKVVEGMDLAEALRLPQQDLQRIWDAFAKANSFFLRMELKNETGQGPSKATGAGRTLLEYVCALVEAGHSENVFEYGIGFFFEILECHFSLEEDRLKRYSSGVRMAFHGGNRDWSRFMKSNNRTDSGGKPGSVLAELILNKKAEGDAE